MTVRHYGISAVPGAYVVPLNRYIAVYENEDPVESHNLSVPCNATGSINDDVTHYIGGQYYSDEKLARYQAKFRENGALRPPPSGWPLVVSGEPMTEAEAEEAVDQMVLVVATADESLIPSIQALALNAVAGALGIVRIEEEQPEC